jgi:nicotinamide riboside transporter PnuC
MSPRLDLHWTGYWPRSSTSCCWWSRYSSHVIVFEDVGPLRGVRRSLKLVSRRVMPVMFVVIMLSLLYGLVAWLFGFYYDKATDVFVLLPVSELLVDALVSLFAQILLVFMFEDLRRQSPARATL